MIIIYIGGSEIVGVVLGIKGVEFIFSRGFDVINSLSHGYRNLVEKCPCAGGEEGVEIIQPHKFCASEMSGYVLPDCVSVHPGAAF